MMTRAPCFLLAWLAAAPAYAAYPPGPVVLPGAAPRIAGEGRAWVGGAYLPGVSVDGFSLGPGAITVGFDSATSSACSAGATLLGSPQSAIDDWNLAASGFGRCNLVQLDSEALNVGAFVFSGLVGEVTGLWGGAGIVGITAEGGFPVVRLDASVPVVPIVFRGEWFAPALYGLTELGVTGVYREHALRVGLANLGPALTYRFEGQGAWFSVTGAMWSGEPTVRARLGYLF
jgi:hypothetical protein